MMMMMYDDDDYCQGVCCDDNQVDDRANREECVRTEIRPQDKYSPTFSWRDNGNHHGDDDADDSCGHDLECVPMEMGL